LAARFVRDEEVVGSNPATPTVKHQVRPGAERSAPGLICVATPFWEPFGSQLGVIFGIRLPGRLPRGGIPPPPSAMYASRPE
jgi:hypothetical protein